MKKKILRLTQTLVVCSLIFCGFAFLSQARAVTEIYADDIVAEARKVIDTPYVSGGYSIEKHGGVDCTGLVYYIYHEKLGYEMTRAQTLSRSQFLKLGTKIENIEDLQPGDIFQFKSFHVGIYIGDNKLIQASNGSYMKVFEGPYWKDNFLYGVRLNNVKQGSSPKKEYSNPLKGNELKVTADFYYNSGTYHGGIDFVAKEGTPLYPVHGGKVLFAGVEMLASGKPAAGGNSILIHGNDGYYYYYCHLKDINYSALREKDEKGNFVFKTVDTSTQIGTTGKTTGTIPNMAPHLHLNVIIPKGSAIPIPSGSGKNGTGGYEWFGNRQGVTIDAKKFLQDKGVLNQKTPAGTSTHKTIKVTTASTSNVTQTNAVLQGTVTKTASDKLLTTGFYFGKSSNLTKEDIVVTFPVNDSTNAYRSGKGFDISCDMEKEAKQILSANTTYYYQCFVTYSGGGEPVVGEVKSFTTKSNTAVVTTDSAKKVTQTNAILYGRVTKNPADKLAVSGFYLGLSPDLTENNTIVTFSVSGSANAYRKGSGFDISCDINDEADMELNAGTTYYYCCFVKYHEEADPILGQVKSFTTP